MTYSIKSNKISRIVWRNGWPSYRFTIDGEVLWLALGVRDVPTVRKIADCITKTIEFERARARLEAAGIKSDLTGDASVLDRFPQLKTKLLALRQRPDVASIEEIITAFKADAIGRDISTKAIASYCSYLLRIIRVVHDVTDAQALQMKATVLKPELLHDYQAAAIAEAKPRGPVAVDAATTTSFSGINQAQSLFSEDTLQGRNMRALQLPLIQITAFKKYRATGTTKKIRVPIDDQQRTLLARAIEDLWFTAPARWQALSLCGNIGLRRGSAKWAKWSWVRRANNKWILYDVASDESQPKGNEVSLEIPDSLWQDMTALRQDGNDYIVPGVTVEERDRVFDENVQWLRGLGLGGRFETKHGKPNHELRAIYAQVMAAVHGLDAAQERMGHDNKSITKLYTGNSTAKPVRPF